MVIADADHEHIGVGNCMHGGLLRCYRKSAGGQFDRRRNAGLLHRGGKGKRATSRFLQHAT